METVLYLLPAIIALKRRHRHVWAIVIMNIFLGWTGFAWVFVLAWACVDVPGPIRGRSPEPEPAALAWWKAQSAPSRITARSSLSGSRTTPAAAGPSPSITGLSVGWPGSRVAISSAAGSPPTAPRSSSWTERQTFI